MESPLYRSLCLSRWKHQHSSCRGDQKQSGQAQKRYLDGLTLEYSRDPSEEQHHGKKNRHERELIPNVAIQDRTLEGLIPFVS